MSATILGLDIGDARIGVSTADAQTPFPAPLRTLSATADVKTTFAQILRELQVVTVVVGYPRNQQGEATHQTRRVEQIVELLKIPDTVKIIWQDESLTSVKAEEELKSRGKPYKKEDIDALAATYILNDYVNSARFGADRQTVQHTEAVAKPQHPSKPPRKRRFTIKLVLLAIASTLLVVVLTVLGWYFTGLRAKTSDDVYSVIKVQTGDTTSNIATKLQNEGIIKNARVFSLYVRINGVNGLQAGSYRLSSAQSVPQIARTIAGGDVTTTDVLVSPGLRLDQIIAQLQNAGFSESEITSGLVAVRDHPLLKNYPKGDSLEGYLYPDTYRVDPQTTAEGFIRTILDTFDAKITDKTRNGLAVQGLTIQQAVILASIVQEEVSDPEVMLTVAQVFIKRYNEGVMLGSDVTYKYAAAQFGTPDNPSSNSPYNTRKFVGLPPTAIANFNLAALEAVANPSNTSYNYFVAGDDGTTYFATTLEQHEANIAKYCIKGCG